MRVPELATFEINNDQKCNVQYGPVVAAGHRLETVNLNVAFLCFVANVKKQNVYIKTWRPL